MLLEADQDLPPEIRKTDLLLVDRSAGNKLPRGEGLYVFSVPTGLAMKRVGVGLKRGFVVTGPGRLHASFQLRVTNVHEPRLLGPNNAYGIRESRDSFGAGPAIKGVPRF